MSLFIKISLLYPKFQVNVSIFQSLFLTCSKVVAPLKLRWHFRDGNRSDLNGPSIRPAPIRGGYDRKLLSSERNNLNLLAIPIPTRLIYNIKYKISFKQLKYLSWQPSTRDISFSLKARDLTFATQHYCWMFFYFYF